MLLGGIAFLLVFVAITPASRHAVAGALSQSGEWMHNWAPFSYILLAGLVAMAIASVVMTVTAPLRVEPENPLRKYRDEQDVMAED